MFINLWLSIGVPFRGQPKTHSKTADGCNFRTPQNATWGSVTFVLGFPSWSSLAKGSRCHAGPAIGTVDGRNPAPPKKPWNDDSLENTNKQGFPIVSKWCRILSIHCVTRVPSRHSQPRTPVPGMASAEAGKRSRCRHPETEGHAKRSPMVCLSNGSSAIVFLLFLGFAKVCVCVCVCVFSSLFLHLHFRQVHSFALLGLAHCSLGNCLVLIEQCSMFSFDTDCGLCI